MQNSHGIACSFSKPCPTIKKLFWLYHGSLTLIPSEERAELSQQTKGNISSFSNFFFSTSQPVGILQDRKNLSIYVNINFELNTTSGFRRISCWRPKKKRNPDVIVSKIQMYWSNEHFFWVIHWIPSPSHWDSQALLQTPQSLLPQPLLLWGAPGSKKIFLFLLSNNLDEWPEQEVTHTPEILNLK